MHMHMDMYIYMYRYRYMYMYIVYRSMHPVYHFLVMLNEDQSMGLTIEKLGLNGVVTI